MYKLEPIGWRRSDHLCPHIREVSHTMAGCSMRLVIIAAIIFVIGRSIKIIGGVLAHSTHLTGLGTYDPATGYESTRIRVTLATSIPEERCRKINLGYIMPNAIKLEEWKGREQEGILVVPHAGERLYRLGE
jgi:hypothetical protein